MPVDGRKKEPTPDGTRAATAPTATLLIETSTAKPSVMPETARLCSRLSKKGGVGRTVRVGEVELEGVAVQPGRRRQVREAGAEDPRPAQGDDGEDRCREGRNRPGRWLRRPCAQRRCAHRSLRSAVLPSPPGDPQAPTDGAPPSGRLTAGRAQPEGLAICQEQTRASPWRARPAGERAGRTSTPV